MHKIDIKPLTANRAWRGRKYKTPEYEQYQKEVFYLLPNIEVPEGKLEVHYIFGLSSKNADYDNCIKQFQDILSETYRFNDKQIYKATIEKRDVKKGEEFIAFRILEYAEPNIC